MGPNPVGVSGIVPIPHWCGCNTPGPGSYYSLMSITGRLGVGVGLQMQGQLWWGWGGLVLGEGSGVITIPTPPHIPGLGWAAASPAWPWGTPHRRLAACNRLPIDQQRVFSQGLRERGLTTRGIDLGRLSQTWLRRRAPCPVSLPGGPPGAWGDAALFPPPFLWSGKLRGKLRVACQSEPEAAGQV